MKLKLDIPEKAKGFYLYFEVDGKHLNDPMPANIQANAKLARRLHGLCGINVTIIDKNRSCKIKECQSSIDTIIVQDGFCSRCGKRHDKWISGTKLTRPPFILDGGGWRRNPPKPKSKKAASPK